MHGRTLPLTLLSAFALGGLALAAAPGTAQAQTNPGSQVIAAMDFQNTDVREALRNLFKNVNVSYTIAPEVQGTINVSLKNVPFDTALQNIARQVDATYRVEGGVYQIVRREEASTPSPTPGELPAVQASGNDRTMIQDDKYLYVLNYNMVYKISKTTMKVVSTATLQ